MRNMLYGNGKGAGLSVWDDEEQRFMVHMRGLPYRATEQDIMNVSWKWLKKIGEITCDVNPSGSVFQTFDSY